MMELKEGLSLDDVMLTPKYNNNSSRLNTDISSNLTERFKLRIPIVSTNMSTITGVDMAAKMNELGAAGALNRFMSIEDNIDAVKYLKEKKISPVVASIGVGNDEFIRAKHLANYGADVLLLDVAHAHAANVFEQLDRLKKLNLKNRGIDVIVGNIATYGAAKEFLDYGVDGLRVGIGGGANCLTRTVTGHGVPNLTALVDVVRARNEFRDNNDRYVPIIMDGGIKNSGDIVKSLYFGADTVSLGNLLAGTRETPGEEVVTEKGIYKKHYGMSSKDAMDIHKGGKRKEIAAEGFSNLVPFKGYVEDIVTELAGGIRSGLTYSGAKDLYELRKYGQPIRLSPAAQSESKYR